MADPTYDIRTSFRSGQISTDTDGNNKSAYFSGVNVRPHGDDLVPRYPYEQINLEIPKGKRGQLSLEKLFNLGIPQALIPYTDFGSPSLIYIVCGVWFKIDVSTLLVTALNYKKGETKLSSNLVFANWTVIDKAVIVFDGDLPLVYDGFEIRRADPNATYTFKNSEGALVAQAVPEATRSYIGAYNNLRFWIGIGSNVLAASDEKGSGPPNAPLSFSQSFTDAGEFTGQFPALSNSTVFERITAMGSFISQNASYTGKLFVSTEGKIYTVESEVFRQEWESTPGFITQVLNGVGVAGNLSWDNFGYDLLFVDSTGETNSLFLAQEDLKRWSETKISAEVSNFIVKQYKDLFKYSSLVSFSNLALQTVNPYPTIRLNETNREVQSFAFKGFLALSTENNSGLTQQAQPVWSGLWEGINPIYAVNLNNVMYILSDDNGRNCFYKCEAKSGMDIYEGKSVPIRSQITTKNIKFSDGGIQDKILRTLDISLDNIDSDLRMLIECKPTSSSTWAFFAKEVFQKNNYLSLQDNVNILGKGGFLKSFKFRTPSNNRSDFFRFRSLDVRITLEGNWKLREYRLKADPLPDNSSIEYNDSNTINPEDNTDYFEPYNLYRTFDSYINYIFNERFNSLGN